MSIFKDCDVRGIYPEEICGDHAYRIGLALGAMLPPGGSARVGGDVRLSTPELKQRLIQGLADAGVKVEDLGTIPTPALYYAMAHGNVDGGAMVTASHNPPKYNGVKLMLGREPLNRQGIDRLKTLSEREAAPRGGGSVSRADILPAYLASLTKRFGARRPLKVVVDAGCGAMWDAAPRAFRGAGYRVTELFCAPDGAFPMRCPNPAEPGALAALSERVRTEGADLGVAFDGDGDRAAFVDEKGRPVSNEKALVLFIRHLLKGHPTPVVYDQKATSAIRREILDMGGAPIPERSGYTFVHRRFREVGAAVAGEVSGHFFFGELGYDDGLYAALTMAGLLAQADVPLSALADGIVCPPITPDLRVDCPEPQQQDWLDRIEALAEGRDCSVEKIDGVRLEFADGWMQIRKSVTAEQITFRAEADTPARLKELVTLASGALPREGGEALLSSALP